MKKEKIFPVLDAIYVAQDDTLDAIIAEQQEIEIDIYSFPLVLVGKDTIILPVTLFKGFAEIGAHTLISHCFLNKATVKDGCKILDSKIFTGIFGKESVVINSTIEHSRLGDNCYANGGTIIESIIKDRVIICGNSNINISRIGSDVILCPQTIIDHTVVEDLCYLDAGVKLLGCVGRSPQYIFVKKKVFIGPNVTITGPIVINHNCYIDSGVEIYPSPDGLIIPPFSYVRRKSSDGYEILNNRSFYLADGLWYVAKDAPVEIAKIVDLKNKLKIWQELSSARNIDIKDILITENSKIDNLTPAQLLTQKDGIQKLSQFIQKEIESLVN